MLRKQNPQIPSVTGLVLVFCVAEWPDKPGYSGSRRQQRSGDALGVERIRFAVCLSAVAMLAASCDAGVGSSSSQSPTAPIVMFAALYGDPGPNGDLGASTVMIVRADGQVRAKAAFTPRHTPVLGRAFTLLQPEARVANGRVYYVDGVGAIRSLSPSGQVDPITTFPLSTQVDHELSFAVSPDGQSLVASVITLPAVISNDQDTPIRDPNGHYLMDIYLASSGGVAHAIRHQDLGSNRDSAMNGNIQLVGWDSAGPLATVNTYWATQQGSPGRYIYGFPLVHLSDSGRPGSAIGGSDCQPAGFLADGRVVCGSQASGVESLRTSSGNVQWSVTAPTSAYLLNAVPSPDGGAIAFANGVLMSNGSFVPTPEIQKGDPVLQIEGWLDSKSLVGAMSCGGQAPTCGHLAVAQVSDRMASIKDLGLRGTFVGVLSHPP